MSLSKRLLGSIEFRDLGSKFTGYFWVGGVSTIADFAIFSLFYYGFGDDLHYLLSATISFVLATGLNYVLSVRYVFQSGGRPRHHEIMMVYVASGVGILINLCVIALAVEVFGLHPLIGKVAGTGTAFGWNFGSRYFWIFRSNGVTDVTTEKA